MSRGGKSFSLFVQWTTTRTTSLHATHGLAGLVACRAELQHEGRLDNNENDLPQRDTRLAAVLVGCRAELTLSARHLPVGFRLLYSSRSSCTSSSIIDHRSALVYIYLVSDILAAVAQQQVGYNRITSSTTSITLDLVRLAFCPSWRRTKSIILLSFQKTSRLSRKRTWMICSNATAAASGG